VPSVGVRPSSAASASCTLLNNGTAEKRQLDAMKVLFSAHEWKTCGRCISRC
jgi:hypothetical protein